MLRIRCQEELSQDVESDTIPALQCSASAKPFVLDLAGYERVLDSSVGQACK